MDGRLFAIVDLVLALYGRGYYEVWCLGVALMVVFYNKELGITETYVDVGKLLHNNSHIQGRKVVRILPERQGSIVRDSL